MVSKSSTAVTFTRAGAVGVAEIDNPPVNAINLAVRVGLSEALDRAKRDPGIEALLIVSAGKTFMAGADITEFGAPPSSPTLQSLEGLARECAIAGDRRRAGPGARDRRRAGPGARGGLELTLSCHYRIAAADSKLGLPEITLGLIPGAGGTQRLPRLIGAELALDMMLSGTPISADEAAVRGLVDEVAAGDLREAAMAFCHRIIAAKTGPRPTRARPVRGELSETGIAAALAKHARTFKGLTAPSLAIEAIQAASLPFAEGMAVEARLADRSLALRESHALRHLFFAERAAGKVPGVPAAPDLPPIRTAAVVGAGTMGSGIALAFADSGVAVTLIDSTEAGLKRGLDIIQGNYAASVQRGRISREAADERIRRIVPSRDLSDAARADVVIEAVFEDLDIKKRGVVRAG